MKKNDPLPLSVLESILNNPSVQFFAHRWENQFMPCAGVTAVNVQERRAFVEEGVYFSPFHRCMASAQKAIVQRRIQPIDFTFEVDFGFGVRRPIRLLLATSEAKGDRIVAPLIFIDILEEQSAFAGIREPHDTLWLRDDTWRYRAAVGALHDVLKLPTKPWIWLQDWLLVPTGDLLHDRGYTTKLHLHTLIDRYQPEWKETALQRGLRKFHVTAGVGEGWVQNFSSEPINRILAPQLVYPGLLDRCRVVPNGNFDQPSDDLARIAEELKNDPRSGSDSLNTYKVAAREKLPKDLRKLIDEKTLGVAMGRASSQKLFDVVVTAFGNILENDPDFPLFIVFAVSDGDERGEERRRKVQLFCEKHPFNSICAGRIDWFNDLMNAADLNFMASLFEPFGGAFAGAALPVVRGVDGLLQVADGVTGWVVREPQLSSWEIDLTELQSGQAWAPFENPTFLAMVESFASGMRNAVNLHRADSSRFAIMVGNAIRFQLGRDWRHPTNGYGRMLML
jgi:glycosyltransferase involved in cell wall biosynthesis